MSLQAPLELRTSVPSHSNSARNLSSSHLREIVTASSALHMPICHCSGCLSRNERSVKVIKAHYTSDAAKLRNPSLPPSVRERITVCVKKNYAFLHLPKEDDNQINPRSKPIRQQGVARSRRTRFKNMSSIMLSSGSLAESSSSATVSAQNQCTETDSKQPQI